MKSIRHSIWQLLRFLAKKSPVPLTKGQRIDRQSARVIRQYCRPDFNCVDVGAHRGEILQLLIDACPNGHHFAFEPLPRLFDILTKKFDKKQKITLFNCALSNESGESTFHHVITNPAYSGIKQRRYDRPNEEVEQIAVKVRELDDCIPPDRPIHFIKIDVEGAELHTLQGSRRILENDHPLLLFEHGLGGADSYQYGANELWDFLTSLNYRIYTLSHFLGNKTHLTRAGMAAHFDKGDEFYFVAK